MAFGDRTVICWEALIVAPPLSGPVDRIKSAKSLVDSFGSYVGKRGVAPALLCRSGIISGREGDLGEVGV